MVKECLPDHGKDGSTHVASRKYKNLKHLILCSDKKVPGFINWSELYKLADQTTSKELKLREDFMEPEDPTNI